MDTVVIGKILKPQGLKGEVKVKPFVDDEKYYKSLSGVTVEGREYSVESLSERQGFLYIKFKGFNKIEDVEFLRSKEIEVSGGNAPELAADEYLIGDMLGLTVTDKNGTELGKIINIEQYGSADIYTILGATGQCSFPFLKKLVVHVDLDKKIMTVNKQVFDEIAVF